MPRAKLSRSRVELPTLQLTQATEVDDAAQQLERLSQFCSQVPLRSRRKIQPSALQPLPAKAPASLGMGPAFEFPAARLTNEFLHMSHFAGKCDNVNQDLAP